MSVNNLINEQSKTTNYLVNLKKKIYDEVNIPNPLDLFEQQAELDNREKILLNKEKMLLSMEKKLKIKQINLSTKELNLSTKAKEINSQNKKQKKKEKELLDLENKLSAKEYELDNKQIELTRQNKNLDEWNQEINKLNQELIIKDDTLSSQKKYLTEWEKDLLGREKHNKLSNQDIDRLQNKLNEKTIQLNMALDELNKIEINNALPEACEKDKRMLRDLLTPFINLYPKLSEIIEQIISDNLTYIVYCDYLINKPSFTIVTNNGKVFYKEGDGYSPNGPVNHYHPYHYADFKIKVMNTKILNLILFLCQPKTYKQEGWGYIRAEPDIKQFC